MNIITCFLLLSLLLLVCPAVTIAGSASVPVASQVDSNAAVRYLMALGHLKPVEATVTEELTAVDGPEAANRLGSTAVSLLNQLDGRGAFALLHFGAVQPDCDFTPDNVGNFRDASPPFRQLRNFGRYAAAQGWRYEAQGKSEEARQLFCDIICFGSHIGRRGATIGAMVGKAVGSIGTTALRSFLTRHPEPEWREKVRRDLAPLPHPAINLTGALMCERRFLQWGIDFVRKNAAELQKYKDSALSKKDPWPPETASTTANPFGPMPKELMAIAGTPEADRMASQALALFDDLLAIPPLDPDAASRSAELHERNKQLDGTGPVNVFVDLLVPNIAKATLQVQALQKEIDDFLR